MKKLATLLLGALVACHNGPATTGTMVGSATGAASPQAALNAYMAAVKAKDLQAMSAVWGSARGSVRETMDRAQMESRETIVIGLLCPDEFRVLRQSEGGSGRKVLNVELKRRTNVMAVRFTTIQGPAGRWYVEDIDLSGDTPQKLQSLCRGP